MSIQSILAPVVAQVLLTLIVMYVMAWRRYTAFSRGELRGSVSLRERNWPERAQQAEYNYLNQFELPVLFYLLAVLAILTRQADLLFVVGAWAFVGLRVLHAWIHLTSNTLPLRGSFFILGAVVLSAMWVVFIARLMLAGS